MLKVILTLILFHHSVFAANKLLKSGLQSFEFTQLPTVPEEVQNANKNQLKPGQISPVQYNKKPGLIDNSTAYSSDVNSTISVNFDNLQGEIFVKEKVKNFIESNSEKPEQLEKFKSDFCRELKVQTSNNAPYFLLNDEFSSDFEEERFQNLSSSIVKEYTDKACPKKDGGQPKLEGCFNDLLADSVKSDKFDKACNDQMDSYLLNKAHDLDLSKAVKLVLNKKAKALGKKEVAPEMPVKSSCSAGCALTNPDGYFTSCNALECNEVGLNESALDIGNVLKLYSMEASNFRPRGTSYFCSDCFLEAAKARKQEFPIEEVEQKFKNKVAGRVAARELLGFAKMMETTTDYNSLSYLKKQVSCEKELSEMLNLKCGNQKKDKNFDARIKEVEGYLGLDMKQPKKLFQKLSEDIKQPGPEQTCTRSDYALKKVNIFNSRKNDGLRYGFKALISQLSSQPLEEEFNKRCEDGEESMMNDSISEFLSTHLSNRLISMVSNLGNKQSDDIQADWHELACDNNDEFVKTLGCNDPVLAEKNPANKFFQEFHSDHNKIISAIKSKYADVGEDGKIDQESLKALLTEMKNLLKTQLQSTLDMASSFDPIVGVNLGSWKNLCELAKRPDGKIEDLVMNNTYHKGLKNFEAESCGKTIAKVKHALCSDIENKKLSENDVNKISDELLGENGSSSFAIKSLTCNLRSKTLNASDKLGFGDAGFGISDYEKTLGKISKGSSGTPMDFDSFKKNETCDEGSRRLEENKLTALTGRFIRRNVVDSGEDKDTADKLEGTTQDIEAAMSRQLDSVRRELTGSTRGGYSDSLISGVEGRVKAIRGGNPYPSAGSGQRKFTVDQKEREVVEQVSQNTRERLLVDREGLDQQRNTKSDVKKQEVEDLFSYMKKPSTDFDTTSNASNSRSPANYSNAPVCDDACLKEVVAKQRMSGTSNEEQKKQLASKLGLKNPSETPEDMKKMLEDVLEGKLNEKELDQLKAENEKLREEMAKIKADMKTKPVKVIDQNGVDRSKEIKRPESNPALVLNPRNNRATEYRSRSSMQEKAEQFSPDYTTSTPERVSIADYKSKRREAAKVPVDQVKTYNAEMDQVFLKSNSNSPVDDGFVKRYVSHISKEAGSIEHLIVFENGVPAKIRVPDPKRPGSYVEHPLEGEIAEEILGQVEKQEVQSFALYNMVSFGDSLNDFMKKLDTEASNITSLRSLNTRLKKLEELD